MQPHPGARFPTAHAPAPDLDPFQGHVSAPKAARKRLQIENFAALVGAFLAPAPRARPAPPPPRPGPGGCVCYPPICAGLFGTGDLFARDRWVSHWQIHTVHARPMGLTSKSARVLSAGIWRRGARP